MSEPAVSICIRGWRRETLPRAIESVLAQGRDDVEIVVGDDAGDLEDVVGRFDDPRVRYQRNPRRLGLTGNARALLDSARGRYLGLLDDDDRVLPGYLDAAIGCLDGNPDVGIVFTNYFYEAGGRLHARDWPLAGGRHDDFLATVLRGSPLMLSSSLMRREVWDEGQRRRPVRDDASFDLTLWARTAEAGWAFYFIDERLAVYAVHAQQLSHDDALIRERSVRLWSSLRFGDAEAERLRRKRLAEALLGRANVRLRRRAVAAAIRDIRAARSAAPGEWLGERGVVALLGVRNGAARLVARHPRLVRPAVTAWRVLRRADRFG